jgi:hypothetical protein
MIRLVTATLADTLEALERDLEFQMLLLTGQARDFGWTRLSAAGSVPLLAAGWKTLTELRWPTSHPEALPGRYVAYSIANHTDRMLYLVFTSPGILTVSMEAADPNWTWSVMENVELPVNLATWYALHPDGNSQTRGNQSSPTH